MTLQISAIPCLGDNYAYLVAAGGSTQALVIDPSQAGPVEDRLSATGLDVTAILTTHHHHDHVGGNLQLSRAHPGLAVYAHGGAGRAVPGQTHDVTHEIGFEAAGLQVRPLHVPGHTLDAIAYLIEDALFTGDTLFVAGCGRLFEGSPAQMHDSLGRVLGELPEDTRIYCGHEYTVQNLRFAATVEPDSGAVRDKLQWAMEQTEQGRPTVPSTLAEEKGTNPFLRAGVPAIAQRYGNGSPAEVFAAIRRAKDQF
jgi:hydroxyacylglutathione hydrolase